MKWRAAKLGLWRTLSDLRPPKSQGSQLSIEGKVELSS